MADPWFKFYPSDWLGGTRGLTAAETGIYITMIAMMYERAAPIDMDRRRLARLCGCPAGAFNKCLDALIDAGKIIETDAGFWNDRVGIERQEREVASQNGTDAARVRWSKQAGKSQVKQPTPDAPALPDACGADASSEARDQKEETGKPVSGASARKAPDFTPQDFDEFWAAYPHRNGKKTKRHDAERAFAKAIKAGATVEQIAAGIESMHRDPDVIRGYARDPTSWLNQRGWTDEIPENTGAAYGNRTPRQAHLNASQSDAAARRVAFAAATPRSPNPNWQ